MYDASDQQLLLATLPPSRRQIRLAYGVMAGLLAAFCAIAPFAPLPLRPVTAFIPVYATTILINDLITAALLFSQFWIVRWTWLLVLAGGYFFGALLIIPYALTFPGVFVPSAVLGAGSQTAAWLSIFWHLASALALIVSVLVRDWRSKADGQRSPAAAIAGSVVIAIALAAGLTWAVIGSEGVLQPIFTDGIHLNPNNSPLMLILALDVVALLLLWRRCVSVLDLWLMVMCCTWLFEISLGGVLAGSRFSLGWYAARVFGLGATFIVLLVLLSEKTALYANLARSVMRQRGARHARQITMDAMAASIGHEIGQPLTAMIVNAGAGMRQLEAPEPDLREMRLILSDIVTEGRRVIEILDGIRTMFKKSAHERLPVDVNQVLRDVLALVDLDLRRQGVTVRTDLGNDLPRVFADRGQLHQLFMNLVANAMEAMHAVADRPSVLRLSSRRIANSTNIAITVEDTGIGIADHESSRIFEPFFTTKTSGTGIGLTICKFITEAHAGSLRVSANEPHGTVVRVTLPMGGYQ